MIDAVDWKDEILPEFATLTRLSYIKGNRLRDSSPDFNWRLSVSVSNCMGQRS